jgi:hypothetical protein
MADRKVGEQHGCVVCGKVYELLVVYNDDGTLKDFTLIFGDGRPIFRYEKPLVACNSHSETQIQDALKKWESKSQDKLDEDE